MFFINNHRIIAHIPIPDGPSAPSPRERPYVDLNKFMVSPLGT